MTKPNSLGQWSSRWMFIMAATGSAVGLGNVWKFPYMTGQYGGSSFVIVYLLCVLLVGLPILIAEIMIGRRGNSSPAEATYKVAVESGKSRHWWWLGFFGMLTAFLFLSVYSIVAGWTASYVVRSLQGDFIGLTPQQVGQMFDDFLADPWQLLIWHTFFMLITVAIVARGLKEGLERAIRWMVPCLFLIILVLVGYALSTPGFMEGIRFMFRVDWAAIDTQSFLSALGHSFFTLSVATASMMIYGAYLEKKASIAKIAVTIATLDTLVALLAGMAIFPLVFTYGLPHDQGPSLVFKTLPIAFGEMPGGGLIGALFFTLLLLAALGSSISLVEPIVAWLVERWNMKRTVAAWASSFLIWFLGLAALLSFNHWEDLRFFGRWTYYTFVDGLVSLIMLPVGGLLLAVFAGWVMKTRYSKEELDMPDWLYKIWHFIVRYFSPIAVIVIAWISI